MISIDSNDEMNRVKWKITLTRVPNTCKEYFAHFADSTAIAKRSEKTTPLFCLSYTDVLTKQRRCFSLCTPRGKKPSFLEKSIRLFQKKSKGYFAVPKSEGEERRVILYFFQQVALLKIIQNLIQNPSNLILLICSSTNFLPS